MDSCEVSFYIWIPQKGIWPNSVGLYDYLLKTLDALGIICYI
jgi:hypothetical protein